MDTIIFWNTYYAPVKIGMTRICHIAGFFLLVIAISATV